MKHRNPYRSRLCIILLIFFAAAFLLPAAQTGDSRLYFLAAALPCGILFLLMLPSGFFSLDRPSVAAALTLCALGILAPAASRPDEALSQGMLTVAALFFLIGGAVLVRSCRVSAPAAVVTAVCALVMLAYPMLFSFGSLSLAEGGMAMLVFSIAIFMAGRRRLPALAVSLIALLLMLLQGDLCDASVWIVTSVLIFWASSGSGLWSLISLLASGGLFAGMLLFSTVCVPSVPEEFLPRLAAIPLIPPEAAVEIVSPDSLFLLLGEQYGLIFLLCAILLLCVLLLCGASLALHTRKAFHAVIALGAVLMFGLQALVYMLSLTGIVPLQAGTFPLLSADIPQLCGEFFLVGLLSGVSARNEADLDEDLRLSMLAH